MQKIKLEGEHQSSIINEDDHIIYGMSGSTGMFLGISYQNKDKTVHIYKAIQRKLSLRHRGEEEVDTRILLVKTSLKILIWRRGGLLAISNCKWVQ